MENELKPCPFCQKTSYLKVEPFFEPSFDGYYGFTVVCSAAGFDNTERGCGSSGGWGETEAGAATAWNTRPAAPVEGLERYDISMFGNGAVEMGGGEYVRFDQAEAIIAAERAEKDEWRKRYHATHERLLEADEKIHALQADNAALTARVKELSALIDGENCADPDKIDALFRRAETAETQLAARNKVLTDIQCIDWDGLSVSDVFDEINEIVERAALEVKP